LERKKEWKAEGRRGFAGAGQKGIAERLARLEGREGGREGEREERSNSIFMSRSLHLTFFNVCERRGGEGGEERGEEKRFQQRQRERGRDREVCACLRAHRQESEGRKEDKTQMRIEI